MLIIITSVDSVIIINNIKKKRSVTQNIIFKENKMNVNNEGVIFLFIYDIYYVDN